MSREDMWDRIMRPYDYQGDAGDIVELFMQNFDKGIFALFGVTVVVIMLMVTSNEWKDICHRRRNRAEYRAARRAQKDAETYSFPVWNEWHQQHLKEIHHDGV